MATLFISRTLCERDLGLCLYASRLLFCSFLAYWHGNFQCLPFGSILIILADFDTHRDLHGTFLGRASCYPPPLAGTKIEPCVLLIIRLHSDRPRGWYAMNLLYGRPIF